MKKRISQTNIQVKQEMYKALMRLLSKKAFSSISVSDITKEAGVSRMAFYRNYSAIEGILAEHLNEVVEEYKIEEMEKIENIVAGEEKIFYEKQYMLHCFQFFYTHREFMDTLISSGMGDLFLSKITEYLIQKWIDREKENDKKEILKVSAYAGCIYNMYREWSRGKFEESPEEIAEILYHLM